MLVGHRVLHTIVDFPVFVVFRFCFFVGSFCVALLLVFSLSAVCCFHFIFACLCCFSACSCFSFLYLRVSSSFVFVVPL